MPHFESDEEHWAAIHAAMDYNPTPDQRAVDEAGADQIYAAIRDAARYQDLELPTGERYHGMHGSHTVREWMDVVMSEHREPLREIKEYRPKMPGVSLPTFEPDNPADYRGLFVIFADRHKTAHSVRYDAVEALVARRAYPRCYWRGLNVFCANYAPRQLCFARGQFVLVFPTCFECKAWLRAGAPEPNTYNELRRRAVDGS